MFKKILLPVDGSEYSSKAIDYVADLAKKYDSKVVLIHAYQVPVEIQDRAVPFGGSVAGIVEIENYLLQCGERLLEKASSGLEERYPDISIATVLKEGKAGSVIEESVENEDYDLIVMGRRGLGAIRSYIFGSVSTYVMHHCKCPLFIV